MAQIKDGYGLVSRRILRDPELSAEAKAIYAYLCSFAGAKNTCYPSMAIMCRELHMSEERLSKHMRALTAAGIVKKERQRNGNRFGGNLYFLSHCTHCQGTENQGIDNTGIEIPSSDNQCPEIPGDNSKQSNINRSNSNNFEELCVYVCDLINQARQSAGSKGRVKPSGGKWVLKSLIERGASFDEIKRAAHDLTEVKKGFSWFDFADYFNRWERSQ